MRAHSLRFAAVIATVSLGLATAQTQVHTAAAAPAPPVALPDPVSPEPANRNPAPTPSPELVLPSGELPARRTLSTRTFRDPDGTLRAEIYSGAINYIDAAGALQPIDNTLVATPSRSGRALPSGYAWQNAANRFTAAFPSRIEGAPVRIDGPWGAVEMGMLGASAAGQQKGSSVTYANALPGVTVSYLAQAESVKQLITLASPAAASTFQHRLKLSPGLTPSLRGNRIIVSGPTGQVGALSAPYMSDAKRDMSNGIRLGLQRSGPDWLVTETVDRAWLNAAGRAWPVVVDPNWTAGTPQADCYLSDGGNANISWCGSPYLGVGYHPGSASRNRTTVKFDALTTGVPKDALVTSADLSLFLTDVISPLPTMSAYPLTRSWTESATWNKYDGTSAWTAAGGDYDPTRTVGTTSNGVNWGDQYTWHPTKMVADMVAGTIPNHGFLIRAATETNGKAHFMSKDGNPSNYHPRLTVRYALARGDQSYFSTTDSI